MDWPFAGALVLLGASFGSSVGGANSHIKTGVPPCVCHCECVSEGESPAGFGLSSVIIAFLLVVIAVLSFLHWWRYPSPQVIEAKGKGKKGVLGGQAALTIQ